MTDTLWAPWRMDYIKSDKEQRCVFCHASQCASTERSDNLVLKVRENEYVVMNRYPYAHAHLLVCPRRHVSNLGDLSKPEQASFFALVADTESVLRKALNPQGVNLGMNLGKAAGAGIESHIHMHLVPRWEGDTNFMPLIADCRIMPDHIQNTYGQLLPLFAAMD